MGNQLISVPAELGQLYRLHTLDLSQNPHLQNLSPEVVWQGVPAILAYLRALLWIWEIFYQDPAILSCIQGFCAELYPESGSIAKLAAGLAALKVDTFTGGSRSESAWCSISRKWRVVFSHNYRNVLWNPSPFSSCVSSYIKINLWGKYCFNFLLNQQFNSIFIFVNLVLRKRWHFITKSRP